MGTATLGIAMDAGDLLSDNRLHDLEMAAGLSTPSMSVQNRNVERSCLTCHQRKIRCDKYSPCSQCVRSDIMCFYPNPKRQAKRPHKTTITEVAARVARLERTITAMSNGTPSADSHTKGTTPSTATPEEASVGDLFVGESSPVGELLVQEGGMSSYFNEILLSRILAEVSQSTVLCLLKAGISLPELENFMLTCTIGQEEELRSVLGVPSLPGTLVADSTPYGNRNIFLGFGQTIADFQISQPTQWQALQLWQAFLNNVDPIARVLHIPTAQIDIYGAINNHANVGEDLKALLFSIYFAATISLSENAVSFILNEKKEIALDHFKQGMEHALTTSGFLDAPNMRSLQALTIYVTCLRAYDCGRASWTLNGLIKRTAQSIGLHRDGKNFGLSPFESEMRRRLWCYMCTADIRAAEDLGISLNDSDPSSDTAFPLNVSDNELSPGIESLPEPKPGWTDMTFSLIKMETAYVSQRVIEGVGSCSVTLPSQESRDQLLKEHISHLETQFMRHCDENIPVQRLTLLSTRVCIAKLEFLVHHQQTFSRGKQQKTASHTSEETLIAACDILAQYLQVLSDELLRGFRWYLSTYFQYHTLTHILWHLCVKPDSPNSARAFKVVEDSFNAVNVDMKPGMKWKIMLQLKAKATRLREATKPLDTISTRASAEIENLGDFGDLAYDDSTIPDLDEYTNFSEWDGIINGLSADGF